jgi:glucose/arabinose dehydrogenase
MDPRRRRPRRVAELKAAARGNEEARLDRQRRIPDAAIRRRRKTVGEEQRPPGDGPLRCAGGGAVHAAGGAEAERVRALLREIRLPDGFRVGLHALAPGARHMAVAPAGGVLFVGSRADRVWAVLGRDGGGRVEEVRAFAPGLRFRAPNGPWLDAGGTLFVPELNRVRAFPAAIERLGEEGPAAAEVVPEGALVPEAELAPSAGAEPNHALRVCRVYRVGPDGRLYVALGQPHDVPAPGKLALYGRLGLGGIVRMERDGGGREIFARGVRNGVGLTFRPGTRELWFTGTDPDGLGDDLPPGEVNRADGPGLHFGFPGTPAGACAPRSTSGASRRPGRSSRRWRRRRTRPTSGWPSTTPASSPPGTAARCSTPSAAPRCPPRRWARG